MKILFVMRHAGAVRTLGSLFQLLEERGHQVHVAFGAVKVAHSYRALQQLAEEGPQITFGRLPGSGSPGWTSSSAAWSILAKQLRLWADSLRYLDRRYAEAEGLRARGAARAPRAVRRLGRLAQGAGPIGVTALRGTVQWLERCLAPPPEVERFVAAQDPDVLVVTHLARWASGEADYVRAAKRLGIRTAYTVLSWDNLTNKGLVRDVPDLVLVWNDLQAAEAVELQGIPAERVRLTGAPAYDHWFEWKPTRSRQDFCREVGLRDDRPIVLYVCSSRFIAHNEVAFVDRWIEALRAHGGLLSDAGILVRPHPRNEKQWRKASLDDPYAVVWPRRGEEPLDEESRQHYFDSIYHSAAVVGINTSAQIESAIVGRPVHTLLADEFRTTQEGTLHFQYLRADEFGHLHVARTMEEHTAQLEASLRGTDGDLNERFLRRFARPFGLDVPATPLVLDAIQALAARPAPAPEAGPLLAPAVRLALRPLAGLAGRRATRLQARVDETASAQHKPRRTVRELAEQNQGPIVAGPWLGDEIRELLHWIPFLCWTEGAVFGIRERLVVVSRAVNAPWYAGIGSRRLLAEDLLTPDQLATLSQTFAEVDPEGSLRVSARRALGTDELVLLTPRLLCDLMARDPRFQGHLRKFAQLAAPELPPELELGLPTDFVAVRFAFDDVYPDTAENREVAAAAVRAVVDAGPVVVVDAPAPLRAELTPLAHGGQLRFLDGIDRSAEAALVARSRGFLGTYGAPAYRAVLAGVPAVALYNSLQETAEHDVRHAARLPQPRFGRLEAIRTDGSAAEAAARAVQLLNGRDRARQHV